jgi:hypothetical protein
MMAIAGVQMTKPLDRPHKQPDRATEYGYHKIKLPPKPGWPKQLPCLGRWCGYAVREAESAGDRLCERCKSAIAQNGGE